MPSYKPSTIKNKQPLLRLGFLMVNQYGGRGGVESVLINITKALIAHNIESYLLYTDEPVHSEFLQHFPHRVLLEKEVNLQQQWYRLLPKFLSRILWKNASKRLISKQFREKIAPLKLDAIISINIPTNFIAFNSTIIKEKERLKLKFISWAHGSFSKLSDEEIAYIKKALPIYDAHLAICKGLQSELKTRLKVSSSLVYNPVLQANIIPRNPEKILYIGRIDDNKRVHNIVKMLKNIQGAWHFEIIGSTGSRENDNHFLQFVAELGLQDRITFHGWQKDPWEKVEDAGVLILNSKSEGFGLVLAEAMMRGIPCISSDCPMGPNEIIIPNENGWLFPVNNEKYGETILQEIISEKRILPNSDVIQKSVQKFAISNAATNFIKTIQKILNNPK